MLRGPAGSKGMPQHAGSTAKFAAFMHAQVVDVAHAWGDCCQPALVSNQQASWLQCKPVHDLHAWLNTW
jgi:hypothetical protein